MLANITTKVEENLDENVIIDNNSEIVDQFNDDNFERVENHDEMNRMFQAKTDAITVKQIEVMNKDVAAAATAINDTSHPYSCETCNRSFKRRFNLKRHYQSHTSKYSISILN